MRSVDQVVEPEEGRAGRGLYGGLGLELGCLAVSVPFLLFPGVMPAVTTGMLAALVLVWLFQLVRGTWMGPVTPFNIPMLLWGIAVGVGTAVTAYPELTLSKATGLILGMAVWRTLGLVSGTRQGLRWAVTGLVVLGIGGVGLGLVSVGWNNKVAFVQPLLDRLPSIALSLPEAPPEGVSPNQLGGLMATLLPLAVAASVDHMRLRGVGRSLLSVLGVIAVGVSLLFTQSRSAWIGSVTGVFTLMVLLGLTSIHRRQRRAVGAGLLLLAVSFGVLASVVAPERLLGLLSMPQPIESPAVGALSLSGRIEIWGRAVYAIQDFVFTGCGLGTFREVIWLLYPPFTIPYGNDLAHAHNIFLQVALDTGIPGLLAYLALLGTSVICAWVVARSGGRYRLLALGLVSSLVALHVYGLADALAPGSKPGLIFWYILGLLAALHQVVRRGGHEGTMAGC